MPKVYYNEIDPFCVEWLKNLISAGHIAPGDVDERDIRDVTPAELVGYSQCHFFAGIGVWSYALRLAGWQDDRPVWTGSCPCQPFSAAGRGGGFADERHLWPYWYHLISVCKPPVVFGEQVASKDGLRWLDLVSTDLEAAGYAVGAADLCAAGVGAPHIRQRLWFVADAQSQRKRSGVARTDRESGQFLAGSESGGNGDDGCKVGFLAHAPKRANNGSLPQSIIGAALPENGGMRSMADPSNRSIPEPGRGPKGRDGDRAANPWKDAEWLWCRDGKYRPVEPSTFPLAHGASARVGRLRAYGNCISPQVAVEFIKAFL